MRSGSAPGWAVELALRVCGDAGVAPPGVLRWRRADRELSTGLTRRQAASIAVTAGRDPDDVRHTLLHELAHWSGAPQRLNRETLNESYRFGDLNYAKEELRAELASVFLMAERGIPHNADSHAAYLGSWLQVLRDDKHEIFRAARDAHRAADLLLALELHKSLDEALSHLKEPHASISQQPICDGAQVIHPTREKEQVALEMEL